MTDNLKKKFKVWKRKDGIIVGKFWGEQDEKDAKRFVEEMYKVINLMKTKVSVLIDASEGGKSRSRARRIYAEFAKSPKLGKTAIYGLTILIKVIATFIIRAAGKKNVKFFLIEKEAIKWLKKKKED